MDPYEKLIYHKALCTWGQDSQTNIAIEEMSELIKELIKAKRGFQNVTELCEELADVQIMINQLRILYDPFDNYFTNLKNTKIEKLKDLLKQKES